MSKLKTTLGGLAVAAAAFAAGRYTAPPVSPFEFDEPVPAQFGSPGGPIGDALREPSFAARAQRLLDAVSSIGPEYVGSVKGALTTKGFRASSMDRMILGYYWSLHEPEAAARWAFETAPVPIKNVMVEVTMEQWARVDPVAATSYLAQVSVAGGPIVDTALQATVAGWYASRLPGLTEYIRSMGPGMMRQLALSEYTTGIIRQEGVDSAIDWVEGLPGDDPMDRKFKLAAHRRLMTEIATDDLARALAWCETACEGEYGDNLRSRLVRVWVSQDPLAALEYLQGAPAGQETDDALVAAFDTWMLYDQDALASYMAAWTRKGKDAIEPWIRPLAAPYALWISWEHPEKALMWASLIDDEDKRRSTLVTIARRWLREDEATANAWLEQSELTEEQREQARTFPPGWRRTTAPAPEA